MAFLENMNFNRMLLCLQLQICIYCSTQFTFVTAYAQTIYYNIITILLQTKPRKYTKKNLYTFFLMSERIFIDQEKVESELSLWLVVGRTRDHFFSFHPFPF